MQRGTPIQALEIYDPATGTFTAAGNELVARDGDRVNRLDNGKIILVGGQTTADATSVTNSTELYSHVTGRFSATGNLITGRQGFAADGLAQWTDPGCGRSCRRRHCAFLCRTLHTADR